LWTGGETTQAVVVETRDGAAIYEFADHAEPGQKYRGETPTPRSVPPFSLATGSVSATSIRTRTYPGRSGASRSGRWRQAALARRQSRRSPSSAEDYLAAYRPRLDFAVSAR
jgi:hypothetical protein